MPSCIQQEHLTNDLFAILEETFEAHHGIYLDKGTSLFETLASITAATASRPVGAMCASLAAQVAHITLYIEVLERYILTGETGTVEWGAIWRTTGAVTAEEWQDLQRKLQQTYYRVRDMLRSREQWNDERLIGGSLAIMVHTAYHLGEIRQALCILG